MYLVFLSLVISLAGCNRHDADIAPNFLFVISDDQSWEHTSRAGYPMVETPNFDRLAREGVYFKNAFVSAPTCTASRSAVLTGQDFWRLGPAGVLWGEYPDTLVSFQDILGEAGYTVGVSGKGWGPGKVQGRRPEGKVYNKLRRPETNLGHVDVVANLEQFLNARAPERPFSFWVGSHEPHRPFNERVADRFQGEQGAVGIPPFLPVTSRVTQQVSGYLSEIEHFDKDLGEMVRLLEERGLLHNTLIIVTSDNGMPFSRAKSTLYRYGVQVPLAIHWGGISSPGRTVEDFATLTDIAPTLLEAAGIEVPDNMTGRSLLPILKSDRGGQVERDRDAAFVGFERHVGGVRGNNLTYSSRAVYTRDFSYIRNTFPERWPAGDPPRFGDTINALLRDPETNSDLEPYFSRVTAKRPGEELYDMRNDPFQFHNLAADEDYAPELTRLRRRLSTYLATTEDPVHLSGEDVFSGYTYHGECAACEQRVIE